MRLHRNLVLAVIDALDQIFNHQKQADKVVAITLKQDKRWGARDRNFVAETIYELVRWQRLYAKIADVENKFEVQSYSTQNLFQLFAIWAILNEIELPKWEEFEGTNYDIDTIKQQFNELQSSRKYRESIPNWLDELGEKELGNETWTKEIAALNKQAPVVLRVNTLKTNLKTLQSQLLEQNIETEKIEDYPEALQLEKRKSIVRNKLYKDGFFEIQDASSQLIGHFLEVKEGMQIIDTCAGAGGKSLHIAALMKNKGQIVSMDIFENKLTELRRRANRANVHNIKTFPIKRKERDIDYNQFKKFHNSADRVLIDAPCSGLGVLSRNPDTKWKLTSSFLEEIKQTQQTILQEYAQMTKKGGKLVYATCSILPSENQIQVEMFLKSKVGQGFEFIGDKKILSHQTGYDGFYMALLRKK
ncbi:RsmB/NOP family class I SAM-dependent RNA methyltransferase [Bernardetia sp.]|uniref:RsmB/NOP family class I SAM-dependent RNA methyltransferase n=1 Tax=Bernardetia sp. TaxID=1937974 RepID=UPI0025C6C80B|nr:RsmB/NOP family class I SAM-dependent RNA methyltransferase [Bernardetia sp.]